MDAKNNTNQHACMQHERDRRILERCCEEKKPDVCENPLFKNVIHTMVIEKYTHRRIKRIKKIHLKYACLVCLIFLITV